MMSNFQKDQVDWLKIGRARMIMDSKNATLNTHTKEFKYVREISKG